ncbi:MAG: restriction endonuclease subunit S, partial [Phascolarctobacterium sp.]
AVTKGLNPDAPMKDSGVEWIGDVPEHWKIMRFKSVVAEISSGISAVTSNESNYTGKYVLRTSAVSSGYFKPDEVKSVTEDAIDRLICPVEKGTVIMSRMNTAKMVGASAYVDRDYENLYLPDKLWKIKFTTKDMGKYCWYALNCVPIQSWFACVATGSSDSMQNIALKDFLDTFFVFPSVNEQNQIVDFLDRKCSAIDATISKKQALIEKLTAYKKSLIYEVVTGKKEV